MGYKLAGYEVIGNCEIDKAINEVYRKNLHPKKTYLCDIRELPDKLDGLEVDILDGSPPCSTFSTAGLREKAWGVEKAFREGQKKQRLDDLFFAFLDVAEVVRPKVIVAENVEGIIKGKAKGYCREIIDRFDELGYTCQMFLLDSSVMGVPQARRRVFFIGAKKELNYPKLKLEFSEKPYTFGEVRSKHSGAELSQLNKRFIQKVRPGETMAKDAALREFGKDSYFSTKLLWDGNTPMTVTSSGSFIRMCDKTYLTDDDLRNVQSFPQDYDFGGQAVQYVCGMSVPPVMMAQISTEIKDQWLLA